MKLLLTGSAGRIGRAIHAAAVGQHVVTGLDRSPFSTTSLIGDVADPERLKRALDGVDAVIHTASLHAPHVGVVADTEFERVNVAGVETLVRLARQAGVPRIVYTSTTALYGAAVDGRSCQWIDETVTPQPTTVYHRTKLAAEQVLADAANDQLAVRVVRMSRCFPEPVDRMAAYRLHRGIDVRDVADVHLAALVAGGASFQRCIASGVTPFQREDLEALWTSPQDVLAERCPQLVADFAARRWPLPSRIDRVYDASAAYSQWGWRSRHGHEEVIAQSERRSLEVLPRLPEFADRTIE
jgi:UDP-glucose 4-epimerase